MGFMKTTIDLSDELLKRSKIEAVKRRTTLKNLVTEGLELVLSKDTQTSAPVGALARLKQGYHLGRRPLSREKSHERLIFSAYKCPSLRL